MLVAPLRSIPINRSYVPMVKQSTTPMHVHQLNHNFFNRGSIGSGGDSMLRIEEILSSQTEMLAELKSQIVSLNDKVDTQQEHIDRIDLVSLCKQCFSVSLNQENFQYSCFNVILVRNSQKYSV